MCNTEGKFLSGSSLYIFKVYEDTLCRLRTKIYRILRILRYPLEGLKHKVKLANTGKIPFSAAGTRNLLFYNKVLHLFLRPGIYGALQSNTVFLTEILYQLIRTKTLFTLFTVHKRIGKACQMTGSHPSLRIHQNGAIDTDIVLRLLYELLPPSLLDVILQLYAKVSVIPSICQPTINFRSGIYKTSGLCQGNNCVHRIVFCHNTSLLHFSDLFSMKITNQPTNNMKSLLFCSLCVG